MNTEQTPELEIEVMEAIKSNQNVYAIKLLRRFRGVSLKEAKLIVDEYIRNNPSCNNETKNKVVWNTDIYTNKNVNNNHIALITGIMGIFFVLSYMGLFSTKKEYQEWQVLALGIGILLLSVGFIIPKSKQQLLLAKINSIIATALIFVAAVSKAFFS